MTYSIQPKVFSESVRSGKTFFSAVVLVFNLVIKQIQKRRRPTKSKSSVAINGAPMTSSKSPVTSSFLVDKAIKEIDHFEGLLFALVKMGFILAYFYICDRTNFFMKENK